MRDIGVDVKVPDGEWDGNMNCPFHGSLRLRGQVLEGTVASIGMSNTIVKRTSALSAHLPSCIGEISVGNNVKVMECRPLSKTVSFCVIENNGGDI